MTKLKILRTNRKLKLRQLAEIVGSTARAIHELEKNGIRTTRLAKLYADKLNVRPQDLLEL